LYLLSFTVYNITCSLSWRVFKVLWAISGPSWPSYCKVENVLLKFLWKFGNLSFEQTWMLFAEKTELQKFIWEHSNCVSTIIVFFLLWSVYSWYQCVPGSITWWYCSYIKSLLLVQSLIGAYTVTLIVVHVVFVSLTTCLTWIFSFLPAIIFIWINIFLLGSL
jgi:hypothetical protein